MLRSALVPASEAAKRSRVLVRKTARGPISAYPVHATDAYPRGYIFSTGLGRSHSESATTAKDKPYDCLRPS